MKKILTLLLITFTIINAQAINKPESLFDLMQYQEVLEIELTTDLQFLKENRRTTESQTAQLSFTDKYGTVQNWSTKVKIRGKFRRMKCEVPPLKLKWKKDDLFAAGLAPEFNDIKMVTHCSASEVEAKEWILKEYLAYKMYEQLSEYAFRTQLVKVTYIHPTTQVKEIQWGMLIEDTAELAYRIDAKKCDECFAQPAERYYAENLKDVSLFQYLIGNADFNINSVKNIKVFEKGDKLITVPYDFDSSGFVSTTYAIPNPNYGLLSVRERVFIGFPEHLSDIKSAKKRFLQQRKGWYQTISDFELLDTEIRREMKGYIKEYFSYHHDLNVVERVVQVID